MIQEIISKSRGYELKGKNGKLTDWLVITVSKLI